MTTAVQPERQNLLRRTKTFYDQVVAEMRKVTWPDVPQIRQLSIGVIVLSLFIGLVIWLLDVVIQLILVRGIPSIFGA